MSITVPRIKNYHDTYWAAGRQTYSGSNQGYVPYLCRWMAAELRDLPSSAPVLEVGGGDAAFTMDFAKYSTAVTTIDLSAGQIKENAVRFPENNFLQHDVSVRLPFADAEFEVVWCSEVLEHLFDPAFALREMHRVLRPGGRLLVTVPYHGGLKNVLIAMFKWDEHYTPSNPHIRFFSKRTLTRLVDAADFRAIRLQTCGIGRLLCDFIEATNIFLHATKGPGAGPRPI